MHQRGLIICSYKSQTRADSYTHRRRYLPCSPVSSWLHVPKYLLHSASSARCFPRLHHCCSAPQLYSSPFTKHYQEIEDAAAVTNWMASDLQWELPKVVKADVTKLGLVGHSRGGKTAFCLALGKAETNLNFSALMGIDPVAGLSMLCRTKPHILNYIPRSFDLRIPVGVIGTGLGSQKKNFLTPACAPDGLNHKEFFNECRPPCCYFVAKDYGHMSMLDDGPAPVGACVCKSGLRPKCLMRKGVGGIVVAFMNSYLKGNESDLLLVTNHPQVAPITFDPVHYIPA